MRNWDGLEVKENRIKTAEGSFIDHPDKVCDQIADATLDEYLRQDPKSRVAIGAMGGAFIN